MLERLDRVAISTKSGIVELPWASRDRLLHEIRNLDGADTNIADTPGTTEPHG